MSDTSPPTVNKIIHLFIVLRMCLHAVLCTWRSEDNFVQEVFSFHPYVGSGGLNLGC